MVQRPINACASTNHHEYITAVSHDVHQGSAPMLYEYQSAKRGLSFSSKPTNYYLKNQQNCWNLTMLKKVCGGGGNPSKPWSTPAKCNWFFDYFLLDPCSKKNKSIYISCVFSCHIVQQSHLKRFWEWDQFPHINRSCSPFTHIYTLLKDFSNTDTHTLMGT